MLLSSAATADLKMPTTETLTSPMVNLWPTLRPRRCATAWPAIAASVRPWKSAQLPESRVRSRAERIFSGGRPLKTTTSRLARQLLVSTLIGHHVLDPRHLGHRPGVILRQTAARRAKAVLLEDDQRPLRLGLAGEVLQPSLHRTDDEEDEQGNRRPADGQERPGAMTPKALEHVGSESKQGQALLCSPCTRTGRVCAGFDQSPILQPQPPRRDCRHLANRASR